MNKFYAAFTARHIADAEYSTSNAKKASKLQARLKDKAMIELFNQCSVNVDIFSRALYASEKAIKFVNYALHQQRDDYNDNFYAAFRTAMNCARAHETMTHADVRASICADASLVDDKRSHLVFQRSNAVALETVDAQSQQCLDVLRSLNILTAVNKNDYVVNINAIAMLMMSNDAAFDELEETAETSDEELDAIDALEADSVVAE